MKDIVVRPVWTAMIVAALLIASTHAAASTTAAGEKPAASAKKMKKTGASGQVRFLPGSAETAGERSRRLRRECRGQVNAGACAGYTR